MYLYNGKIFEMGFKLLSRLWILSLLKMRLCLLSIIREIIWGVLLGFYYVLLL